MKREEGRGSGSARGGAPTAGSVGIIDETEGGGSGSGGGGPETPTLIGQYAAAGPVGGHNALSGYLCWCGRCSGGDNRRSRIDVELTLGFSNSGREGMLRPVSLVEGFICGSKSSIDRGESLSSPVEALGKVV